MIAIDANTIVPIVVAVIGAVSGILAWWNNHQTATKMNKIEQTKVDSEAYERARVFFQASINEMEERIIRLKTELKDARERNDRLRGRIEELETTVQHLKKTLRVAGIELI